ncbi:MAG: hypothetical protein ABIY50_13675 [Ignavibacteria bacterium]
MIKDIDNNIKRPEEVDLDLERNGRLLNRDMEKVSQLSLNNLKDSEDVKVEENCSTEKNGTNLNATFDYEKKYGVEDEGNNLRKTSGNELNTLPNDSDSKLNPKTEQLTMPCPDPKKNYDLHNKKNRNQPL